MGEIERFRRSGSPQHRSMGDAARREVTFSGELVEYDERGHTLEEAWQRLSGGMRDWAQQRAGDQITDPHTKTKTVYWYCGIWRPDASGPQGAPEPAAYSLVMFGKRGLVISDGTTDDFVDRPGATRWRNRRIALPIDPLAIRHDHHGDAAANTAVTGAAAGTGGAAAPQVLAPDLADSDVPVWLGNLPAATQRFLFEPFTGTRRRATHAMVHAYLDWFGAEMREQHWAYLFNARWMGFAYTVRSVPVRGMSRVTRAFTASPDRRRLLRAPWRVCAWVAPILRDGR